MPSREKSVAPKEILDLVERFERQLEASLSGQDNQAGSIGHLPLSLDGIGLGRRFAAVEGSCSQTLPDL